MLVEVHQKISKAYVLTEFGLEVLAKPEEIEEAVEKYEKKKRIVKGRF